MKHKRGGEKSKDMYDDDKIRRKRRRIGIQLAYVKKLIDYL